MRFSIPIALLALVFVTAGCGDSLLGSDDASKSEVTSRSNDGTVASLLRNSQLLPRALGSTGMDPASKWDPNNLTAQSLEADLYAIVGFNFYEADGVTRRVLDEFAISRRILDEYGVTRRVLAQYGVTMRVLDQYGITRRILDEYGITRRILDEYGITRRILDEYGMTEAEFDAAFANYESDVKLRVLEDGFISVKIKGGKWMDILLEMWDDADIGYVEPDPVSQAVDLGSFAMKDNSDQFIPYGVDRVGAIGASYSSDDLHVYLLDSGVYAADVKLAEAKDFTMLFLNRDQETWDDSQYMNPGYFDPGDAGNPADENGHGTHVAGTLAATDNKIGIIGVAPKLDLHSLKVLTARGQTDVTTVVAAINYVVQRKKTVHLPTDKVLINLSIGMDTGTTAYNALDEAVKEAVAEGIVVVVSAGNNAEDASTYSPAHVAEAITVGAYNPNDSFAVFSNFGPSVDLLAPGVDVVSLPHGAWEASKNWRIVQSGTSMAAPHVTAAAAIYWSMHPHATPAEVEAGLKAYAKSGIKNVPTGTTDRTVHVGFAVPTTFKPFALSGAKWDDAGSYLEVTGDGTAAATVQIVSAGSNTSLGSTSIMADGKFVAIIRNPAAIPCSVVASDGAAQSSMAVSGAPADCDGSTVAPAESMTPIVIGKHEWSAKKKMLILDGSGPANRTLEIRAASNGTLFGTPTTDETGGWKFDGTNVPFIPCAVTVSYASQSVTTDISNGTRDCR